MKTLNRLVIFMISASLCLACAGSIIAQEEGSSESAVSADPAEEAVQSAVPTREDMLERVNVILKNRTDIRGAIPGVAIIPTEDDSYVEFNGVRVEELSDEALKILVSITK